MALPVGVTTCNLTIGTDLDFFGNDASLSVTVQPILGGSATSIAWSATGQALDNFPKTSTAGAGVGITVAVPHVNQAGFIDGLGNAVTMWAYEVTIVATLNGQSKTRIKYAQPLVGQSTVDLDLIPDGSLTSPFSVPRVGAVASGAGSPEGSVTAPVGVLYMDTAATTGAVLWRKATGSGNTGWLVVSGDTGQRSLTTWTSGGVVTGETLSGSWAPTSGAAGGIYIRRVGAICTLLIDDLDRVNDTTPNVWSPYVLPVGFRPTRTIARNYIHTTGNGTLWVTSGGALQRATGGVGGTTGSLVAVDAVYVTNDAWPTSLPGS